MTQKIQCEDYLVVRSHRDLLQTGPQSHFHFVRSSPQPTLLECPDQDDPQRTTGSLRPLARAYREKWVCWTCRRYSKTQESSWRSKHPLSDLDTWILPLQGTGSKLPSCPLCHNEMIIVGPKFAPPPQRDLKSWQAAHLKWTQNPSCFEYTTRELELRSQGIPRISK